MGAIERRTIYALLHAVDKPGLSTLGGICRVTIGAYGSRDEAQRALDLYRRTDPCSSDLELVEVEVIVRLPVGVE